MTALTKITLGGVGYTVPPADLGQFEELLAAWEEMEKDERALGGSVRGAIAIAKILLRDAEPKIEDVRRLRCAPAELRAATSAILAASGLTSSGEAKAEAAA